jgi:DNA-directed RNA polymerase subunit L
MDHARLASQLEPLETLGQVLRWALGQSPRAEFVNVVVQDEFTHDVIVRIAADLYAVFDAT